MTLSLASPLPLPCGVVLKNRIGKAPLTEGLADGLNRATARHVRLYRAWAEGGAGVVVTGNVQVDRRYLERPGNVVIDGAPDAAAMAALRAYAVAGGANGTALWMQLNHPGRQTPRRVCEQPVAPSAVPLDLPASAFAPPRALEVEEIDVVGGRFVHAARVAQAAGFGGVQVHSAHGYLLSQFLSPKANRRTDRWGGSLENRARLLLDVVRGVRSACGKSFAVSVKLNSSDFQQGGFTNEECLQVVRWLDEAGVDLLEISGGNYESPSMMNGKATGGADAPKDSTVRREAYFLEYAEAMRAVTRMPLMVTGGFRSRPAMEAALASGALDVVGLGRPMCVEPDLPNKLLADSQAAGTPWEAQIKPAKAGLGWFCMQLIRIGDGQPADTEMTGEQAMAAYVANEEATAQRLEAAAA
jgi:2,4-dienoyl-CoA reductase-like NADH-dependent reductase (Old Yellow Enzyme family)